MNLKICGDKSRLQSSLDFYLKITSMSEYKNIEALRKGMFSKFMEEERSRESSYLALSRNDDVIELAREREERLEGELFNGDIVGHGRYLEEYEEVDGSEETEDLELGESVSGCKSFLEAVRTSVQVEEEEPLDVEENERFEVKEPIIGSKGFLDAVRNIENRVFDCSVERVNHGRYLEDYVEEEIEDYEEFEEKEIKKDIESAQSVIKEFIEHVDHGRYLEDYVPEDVEEVGGTDNYEEEEDENIEDTIEDVSDWMDSLFSSLKKDEPKSDVVKEEVAEKPKEEVEVFEREVEEHRERVKEREEALRVERYDRGSRFEEGIFEEDEKDSSPKMFEDLVQQPIQNTEMSFTKEEVEEELPEKEEMIVKPANIRDFLRQHPNSSVEFVMQYYSKKEIDKALALGKIYKKKGKLMI